MSVGTLITLHNGKIVKREPVWPFPPQEAFPRLNADGSITYFVTRPYYYYPLGSSLDTNSHKGK